MPSSRAETIPHVINIVGSYKPKSILDVGIGFGKYGFLFREYLEIWTDTESGKRVHPRNWKTRIDGIEIWKKYISRVQRAVYDNIHIGDALAVIRGLGIYDVIFCGDMIEHLTKAQGHILINFMVDHAAKAVVIVSPAYKERTRDDGVVVKKQGRSHGNPFEAHLSHWIRSDFDNYENCTYYLVDNKYGIVVIEKEKTDDNGPHQS